MYARRQVSYPEAWSRAVRSTTATRCDGGCRTAQHNACMPAAVAAARDNYCFGWLTLRVECARALFCRRHSRQQCGRCRVPLVLCMQHRGAAPHRLALDPATRSEMVDMVVRGLSRSLFEEGVARRQRARLAAGGRRSADACEARAKGQRGGGISNRQCGYVCSKRLRFRVRLHSVAVIQSRYCTGSWGRGRNRG